MQNIIVLDDEKEIADLLEVYLTNEGYQVFKFYRAEGCSTASGTMRSHWRSLM